jgi:small subunit ribosomal protein S17e
MVRFIKEKAIQSHWWVFMGRIKTMLIKRNSEELLEKHGDTFTDDFEHNKQKVGQIINTPSKKLRNVIAGYVTRLKKKETEI